MELDPQCDAKFLSWWWKEATVDSDWIDLSKIELVRGCVLVGGFLAALPFSQVATRSAVSSLHRSLDAFHILTPKFSLQKTLVEKRACVQPMVKNPPETGNKISTEYMYDTHSTRTYERLSWLLTSQVTASGMQMHSCPSLCQPNHCCGLLSNRWSIPKEKRCKEVDQKQQALSP